MKASRYLASVSHALRPFKPRLRGAPADLPFVLDAATLRAGLNFALMTEVGDVDLLGEVTGLGPYEIVKAHAEEVELYAHCPGAKPAEPGPGRAKGSSKPWEWA